MTSHEAVHDDSVEKHSRWYRLGPIRRLSDSAEHFRCQGRSLNDSIFKRLMGIIAKSK